MFGTRSHSLLSPRTSVSLSCTRADFLLPIYNPPSPQFQMSLPRAGRADGRAGGFVFGRRGPRKRDPRAASPSLAFAVTFRLPRSLPREATRFPPSSLSYLGHVSSKLRGCLPSLSSLPSRTPTPSPSPARRPYLICSYVRTHCTALCPAPCLHGLRTDRPRHGEGGGPSSSPNIPPAAGACGLRPAGDPLAHRG